MMKSIDKLVNIQLDSFAKVRKSSVFKDKRFALFLDLLGNPESKFTSIHVAGTSGKGSTATFVSSILGAAGYKVGLNLSPHVNRVNERIQINNTEISTKNLYEYLNQILPITKRVKETISGLSYFEVITGLAFYFFASQKCEIAVIEAGIGGTRDITNVLKPEVCIITNVDLDHTRVLGNTVEKIAQNKAGIIKPGIPVVSGVTQQSVVQIVQAKADQEKSPLYLLGRDFGLENNYEIGMQGEHQIANATLAVKSALVLGEKGWNISEAHIREGLKSAFLPGRFQVISVEPTIILDGAHNPAKIKAVVKTTQDLFPKKKVVTIFAPKKDKDSQAMLRELAPITEKFVLTQLEGFEDLELIDRTEDFVRKSLGLEVEFCSNTKKAARRIKKFSPDSVVLVTGSFYLVGEITNSLQKNS